MSEVMIRTVPKLDGSGYMVVVEADEDTSRALTPDEAVRYVRVLLDAVARAEYDAVVMRQMTKKLHVGVLEASQVVKDLRADRPPLADADTAPLVFTPAVTEQFKPFLTLGMGGELIGQWEMADAKDHALHLLLAVSVADLDSAYLRVLTGPIGVLKPVGLSVVDDLRKYREES